MVQFHQHFMCSSFYAYRSKKHKRDTELRQLFALMGSAGVKAARKHVMKLTLDESSQVESKNLKGKIIGN